MLGLMSEHDIDWFGRPGGEAVRLCAYSAEWEQRAREWIVAIKDALEACQPAIDHIGSTAVPGLIAKSVIDLLVAVPDVTDEPSYRAGLESLGLILRAREPDHRFFRPPAGEPRLVHVHVCEVGSSWQQDRLLFRDRLRTQPGTAAAYARLKEDLARRVGEDRGRYNQGKTNFIHSVLTAAGRHPQG